MPEIGSTLREARLRAKIDISEVETATKIRAKYLRALENEEWNLLPGPAYVKSFLRTYAAYLGLDVTLLIEEYKRRHEHPSDLDQLPVTPSFGDRRRPPRPPRVPRGWIVGGAIVALLVLFAIIGMQSDDADEPTGARETTERRSDSDRERERRRERRRARERERRRERAAARRPVRLKLEPQGVVFACVVDVSGNPVVNDTLEAGAPTPTLRSRRFRMTLGNGSIVLRVNGRAIDVPESATAIAYVVTSRGARQVPAEDGPTCG